MVSHGRYVTFQWPEVAAPKHQRRRILRLIDGLWPASGACLTESLDRAGEATDHMSAKDGRSDRYGIETLVLQVFGAVAFKGTAVPVHLGANVW